MIVLWISSYKFKLSSTSRFFRNFFWSLNLYLIIPDFNNTVEKIIKYINGGKP